MDFKTFKEKAIKTESRPTSLNFGTLSLHSVLGVAILSAEIMDVAKKTIFYGKPLDEGRMVGLINGLGETMTFLAHHVSAGAAMDVNDIEKFRDLSDFPEELKVAKASNVNLRLLHGAIGMFTEAGELLSAVCAQLETGELDMVNVGEELGDSDWYKAIIHDETGTDEGDIRAKVINKLMVRYPGKFSADAAENRDLAAERVALEGEAEVAQL
jgi:hypothetical protein